MEGISDWVDGELMVVHSRAMLYLLNKLQDVVAGGLLQMTGLVALFYAGVLFTEGIGVYLQRRWAEMLMVFATATLIPFEVRHVWFHPRCRRHHYPGGKLFHCLVPLSRAAARASRGNNSRG